MVTQTLTRTALSACYNNKNLSYYYIDCFDNVIKQLVHASAVRMSRY